MQQVDATLLENALDEYIVRVALPALCPASSVVIAEDGESGRRRRKSRERIHILARVEIMPERNEIAGDADEVGRAFQPERDRVLNQRQRHNKRRVKIGKMKDA